jgi:hypothetical protein
VGAVAPGIISTSGVLPLEEWGGPGASYARPPTADDISMLSQTLTDALGLPQVRKTPSWPRSWANFSLV